MNESDLRALPELTKRLALHLSSLGFDRARIHGFFVLLGLYAGAPDTKEKLDRLFSCLDKVLPLDRSNNIDEIVGHIYDGYDRQINEFCFRSGADFKFRQISVPGASKTFAIVYLKDEGLLRSSIRSIESLIDASQLYDSFIQALGQSTVAREANLLEAFTCGVFQIQLHARFDVSGARQIAGLIQAGLPIFLGRCFNSFIGDRVDYFIGLVGEQAALLELMQAMETTYAREMWGFQSHLFFHEQELISGIDALSPAGWHDWVLDRGKAFDAAYASQLTPFSQSGVTLVDIPSWDDDIEDFEVCDKYIEGVWGYRGQSLTGRMEIHEYRALMVYLIYSSLTQAREVSH